MPSFSGQMTRAGKPIVVAKGKSYQVPQRGVMSPKTALLSGASSAALTVRWSEQKRLAVKNKFNELARKDVAKKVWLARQQREKKLLDSRAKIKDIKSEISEAPVPGATGGERVGKGPRIWSKPPSDDPIGEATRDFDRKFPDSENVDDKGNGVRIGTLPDGKRVIFRLKSSERSGNVPTIEIQNPSGSKLLDKIRYPQR
jgi:hypothetical protein